MKINLLICCLLITTTSQAQSFKNIDSLINSLLKQYQIKGIGVVGVDNGKVIYINSAGIANPNAQFTDSTRIYIASNTKAFTGLAMAKLAFEKKVSYSDAITKFIPAHYFPDHIQADKITIKDLLCHTHGLSNDPLVFRTAYSGENPESLQNLLKFTEYSKDSLTKEFKYSNTGYLLAGIIIENVTGEKWEEYIHKNILLPIGMYSSETRISFDEIDEILPYDFDMDKPLLHSRKSQNTLHAAGGIYSTLPDMGKWLGIFTDKNQSLVDSKLIDQYLNEVTIVDKREGPIYNKSYGNGWIFGDLINKKNIYYHFGRFKGYESVMSFDPVSNRGVFVFVNERIAGIYVAAFLSNYFYIVAEEQTTNENFEQVMKLIKNQYSSPVNRLVQPFKDKNNIDLPGIYLSDKYGTLLVDKLPEGYTFKLGNMTSLGYMGKEKNEILVEWTPGIIEHLYIIEKGDSIMIRYDNFDVFNKL